MISEGHRSNFPGDTMLRCLLLAAVALAAFASPGHTQGPPPLFPPFMDMRGTPEDQRACRPDAVRLCRHLLEQNDSMVVLQCFLANRTKLSAPCRGVLQKYGQL
jgi:hypothetical protein